jgi:UDP-N-acetylmuramyl pentapeptide phosphotransferase/UDP-N-acetylglucosamine-1-phosphate transferase
VTIVLHGLDGLAGGVAIVTLAWLASCAGTIGADNILVMVSTLATAISRFL